MRTRLGELVAALRDRGVAVSVAEAIDAAQAVAAGGVARDVLRECLAATLIKDEGDRPVFLKAQSRVERRHFRQRVDLMIYEKNRQEILKDLGADPYVD